MTKGKPPSYFGLPVPMWRARLAGWLVALARRLDPLC